MSAFQKAGLVLFLGLIPTYSISGGDWVFEYSFGNKLVVNGRTETFKMTVSNPTESETACQLFQVWDFTHDDIFNPRLNFRTLKGKDDCFGGFCPPFEPGPPGVVLAGYMAPYAAGETRVCEFEVEILQSFEDSIILAGFQPFVVEQKPAAVSTLRDSGKFLLVVILSLAVLLWGRKFKFGDNEAA
jgi:hypothetical protein